MIIERLLLPAVPVFIVYAGFTNQSRGNDLRALLCDNSVFVADSKSRSAFCGYKPYCLPSLSYMFENSPAYRSLTDFPRVTSWKNLIKIRTISLCWLFIYSLILVTFFDNALLIW